MNEWFDAEAHAEKAHQYFETGQWEKALAELKLALAVNPEQSDWHFGMGLTLDALGLHAEAISSFERVLELRGQDVDAMLHLSVDLLRTDQPRRAISVLERVSNIDPENEPAYCHRIAAYAQVGDHEQAEEMFYRARQVVDECPTCFDHIAQSLAQRNRMEKAIWCWQQTARLDPRYPGVYANLARAHWHQGQPERARQYFLHQLRQDPGDTQVLVELGQLLIAMGRRSEASEKFRRALELDSTVAQAHLHLGELAMDAGHMDAAQLDLEMAGRLAPDLPGVQLRLAQLCRKRGKLDLARQHARTELGLEIHREPSQTLELAQLLIEIGMPEPARLLLTGLLDEENPLQPTRQQRATALLYRGAALLLLHQHRRGIIDCRRALKLAPTNTLAMHNLVLAHIELREFQRARYWLRRAVELRPNDTQLRSLGLRLLRSVVTSWWQRLLLRKPKTA